MGSEEKLVKRLFEQAAIKNPADKIGLDEAYVTLCKQSLVATGADFHITLGGDIFIVYTCRRLLHSPH